MGWQIEYTKALRIKLREYHAIARGKCAGLEIDVDVRITVDTLLFDLEGIGVVLGKSWLTILQSFFKEPRWLDTIKYFA